MDIKALLEEAVKAELTKMLGLGSVPSGLVRDGSGSGYGDG